MSDLLGAEPVVVTAGVDVLADAVADQALDVGRVDWRPPPPEVRDDLAVVALDPLRHGANAQAVGRMLAATAELVAVRPARDALGLGPGWLLHAGPPITWERASGPMRGALIGALLLEGWAGTPAEAERRLAGGEVDLEPCHHRGAVGPMAGVVSPSMWVVELRDEVHDRTAWCTLNEGLGKVLRYGAYGPEVVERLRWMNGVLGPALADAVADHGPVDVRAVLGQMVQMGDEAHNRNRAGTLMLLRDLLPSLAVTRPSGEVADVARFIGGNDHFFLNVGMPACKLITAAAHGVPGSTVVTAMARNGTDFGIRVSGADDQWFVAPAEVPDGLYLGAYGPADANPDIGDSAITETAGLGGLAMATAPAIVRFVGGSVPDAVRTTTLMYEITLTEHDAFAIPALEFRGAPTAIDVTAVVRTGILPQINTGIAGKVPGTGQVGAGLVTPPVACFTQALAALAGRARERATGALRAPDPLVTDG